MELKEIQKKIIAIQFIQELIVDVLDEAEIIKRKDFEILLDMRVQESKQNEIIFSNIFNGPIGEA
jgi:hypothetical protein